MVGSSPVVSSAGVSSHGVSSPREVDEVSSTREVAYGALVERFS